MPAKRLVLLVPTEQDMTNEKYLSTYWPNFVYRVREALDQCGLDCEVRVVGRSEQSSEGRP